MHLAGAISSFTKILTIFYLSALKCFICPLSGPKGDVGLPGLPGNPGYVPPVGFPMTKHSQSRTLPECPAGMNKMWEGYSLLYIESNERSHHQDLGMFQQFYFMILYVCNFYGQCKNSKTAILFFWNFNKCLSALK